VSSIRSPEVARHQIRLEQERLPIEAVHQEIERLYPAFIAEAHPDPVP